MLARDRLLTTHAEALRARGHLLPPDGLPPGEILDSWVRCMAGGQDPAVPMAVPVVLGSDLARRRERAAIVRRLAQAELETLASQIAGSNFLLAFADQDGVILDLYADNRFVMSGSGAGIVAGSRWDESLAGTNGLGTALAVGRPVAVTGREHYYFSLGDISCTAAPVRDAAGDLVGVLDASSYVESRQRHTQALVQMAAAHIENGLLLHQMAGQTVLAVHPRAEFLGTLSAGLLAFDEAGCLGALNARAAGLLSGLSAARGTACEDLFGEPFDQLMERLQLGHDLRLRDVLGSALVARVVRRPALPAGRRSTLEDRSLLRSVQPAVLHPVQPAVLHPVPPALNSPVQPAVQHPVQPAVQHLRAAAPDIVAADSVVADAFNLASAAVRLKVPILIEGEAGSGKEWLARHAHDSSGRSGAFIAVNCAAVPAELFEATLFGHVEGGGAGARYGGSGGLIASADGGTLLLDEVRGLPLPLQAALLRFLDDGLVRPVGGAQARRVDVQLVATTDAALEDEVAARRFRQDLLYRLNVVKVVLPPLRRRSDFADAVRCLLASIDPGATLHDDAVERLARHRWPGNFRELRAVLTRAVLARRQQAGTASIGTGDVDALLPPVGAAAGVSDRDGRRSALSASATDRVCREFERCGRSVSRTARSLGVSRTTVYRHLREGGDPSAR
jgi:sigma-54 dependent transcriptional regulator, acetoin dehydrogenase operon transcriptional activator AcoR